LVYSAFQKDCELAAKHLHTRCAIPTDYFHGGMIESQKADVIDNVFDQQVRHYDVLNCTVAFGLGVDIPGTEYVISDSVPLSKAEVVQLSGRAGRDPRKEAKYMLLASPARWARQYSLVYESPEVAVRLSESILMALDFTHCAHAKLGMWPSELISPHLSPKVLMGPTCESRCTAWRAGRAARGQAAAPCRCKRWRGSSSGRRARARGAWWAGWWATGAHRRSAPSARPTCCSTSATPISSMSRTCRRRCWW
jgi:hypothetical protein